MEIILVCFEKWEYNTVTMITLEGFFLLLKGIALLALVLAALVFFVAGTPVWSLPLLFLGFDLGLLLLSVLFLWICCATVDMSKPQEEDSRFFRCLMHPYIEALISIVGIRLHTQGLSLIHI